jgi:hypothetical protein
MELVISIDVTVGIPLSSIDCREQRSMATLNVFTKEVNYFLSRAFVIHACSLT